MRQILTITAGILLAFVVIALALHIYGAVVQHQAEAERLQLEEAKCSDGSPLSTEQISRCAVIYNRNSEADLDARQRPQH